MPASGRSSSRPNEPREDDHYFVVNGRRWRKTDPHIPEKLRAELVKELMAARRVQDRPRVQDAKVALGERGEKWWEAPSDEGSRKRLLARHASSPARPSGDLVDLPLRRRPHRRRSTLAGASSPGA